MTTDITELAQRMKAAAKKATQGEWRRASTQFNGITATPFMLGRKEVMIAGASEKRDAEFIAMANPANILALVEALEKAQCAGSINNQWKPDVCPITGRRFFLWIEHPELGYVPTYGGPHDSYTIPTRDSDGEFSCERYDHDFGGWVDGECVGAYLIDDDEQSRVYELEQRIASLETINAAAEKLVRCKGRYHSEQNYRALAALFGVTTPDLPSLEHENVHYADAAEMEIAALRQRISELESRTVTIEPFRSFVTDADLSALHRFAECCDDPESGGHDLEKEQVRRLESIGALQRSGRISYITGFGDFLISITAGIKWEAE